MNVNVLYGKRIFLIEDNLANLAITKTLLEQQGAIVGVERWGKNTIEKLDKFLPVDVILLDLMFPNKVTGYDIFHMIRTYSEFAHIPVIAVSASDPSETIPRVHAMGFDGFISKPVDYDLFPQQVRTILVGKRR